MAPSILIAGTNSGCGKTTVTLAIMAALKKKGLRVQGFKCGPDYIDTAYHAAVTRQPSYNLDSFFSTPQQLRRSFFEHSAQANIAVIEGVMGLFDGKAADKNTGSTAEIAGILNVPVVLVINAASMARSAAALVRGFQIFGKKIRIAGVIANRCGSKNHIELIRTAVETECKIPLLGGILRQDNIQIPERQLGLLPALERGELNSLFKRLATLAKEQIDLEQILKTARQYKTAFPGTVTPQTVSGGNTGKEKIIVAVAKDQAFNFYYPENLELMKNSGMTLKYFSPLKDEALPLNACGLYIGGGFPEEFAKVLSKNNKSKKSIQDAVESGMPCIAECGGFMYLTESLRTAVNGKRFQSGSGGSLPTRSLKDGKYTMCRILPGGIVMQNRLSALGYREISGLKNNYLLRENEMIKGHEFHYSVYEGPKNSKNILPAFHFKGRNVNGQSGLMYKNLVASYAHFYFPSRPEFVSRWTEKCRQYRDKKVS